MRILTVILISILVFSSFEGKTQNDISNTSSTVSKTEYENLKTEVPFDNTKRALRPKPPKEKEKKKKKDVSDKKKPKKKSWISNLTFLQVIPYIVIFLVVGLILYYIFSNIEIDKKIEPKFKNEFDIDDIEEVDTLEGYEKALAEGDYRSAIRWRFLNVLQLLSTTNVIDWQPEKTNRDYNRELRGHPHSSKFSVLVRIFENVWYGNHDIDKDIFKELDIHFKSFIDEEKP